MSETCTLKDIHNAIEAGDLKFASALLKDYLFNNPDEPEAWLLLARYFIDIEMAPFAYPVCLAAIEQRRDWRSLMTLGAVAAVMQRAEEGVKTLKAALKLLPDNESDQHKAIMYRMLANAHVQAFNFDAAEHWAKKSLELEDYHQAHTCLGFAYLHQRKWKEGWREYKSQLGHVDKRPKHDYGIPDWQGEPDARLLVYGDQGLGDQIAYMSAMPMRPVQINCHKKLANLFRRSFPKSEVYGDMFKTHFDWELRCTHQASMAEVMQWAEMKRRGRYLEPMREKKLQWRGLLASTGTKPKVGIAWTGGSTGSDGWRTRNLSLDMLRPILELPYTFVSLQYTDCSDEIDRFEDRTGIKILDWQWGTITFDYDDTAALVDGLDAVITVPTTAYHLAGGLGKPACVLVHDQPHFHEGTFGESPWWESVDFIRRPDHESDAAAIQAAADWLVNIIEDRSAVQAVNA